MADGQLFDPLHELPEPRMKVDQCHSFESSSRCALLCYRGANGLPICRDHCIKLETARALIWWRT